MGNEPYGVDWSKPVARFEEALATIRALWNSKGELVNRDSPFFPLRDAIFDLPPYKGKWPEIWIAAHGPRMLRATGRYGDAWFPGFAHRPQDYAERLEIIRSRRPPMQGATRCRSRRRCGCRSSPVPSREAVDAALDSTVVKAWALNGPAEFYAHHGAEHPMGADFAGMQDHVVVHHGRADDPRKVFSGPAFGGEGDGAERHCRRRPRAGRGMARPRRALHRGRQLRPDAAEPAERTGARCSRSTRWSAASSGCDFACNGSGRAPNGQGVITVRLTGSAAAWRL